MSLVVPRALPRGLALFGGPRTVPPQAGVSGMVVDAMTATWAGLEPEPGVYELGRLRSALDYARAAQVTGCDLRVYAGVRAPEWLKARVGAVAYADGQDGPAGATARFWEAEYAAAWAGLQGALADGLGGDPLLRSVSHALPMTLYAEPFMRGDPATRRDLAAAGLSDDADLAAHRAGVDAHAAAWSAHGVRLRIALNPWASAATGTTSVPRLAEVIDYTLRVLGPRGVILQNNSIRTPTLGGMYPELYALMRWYRDQGVPVAYQSASDSRVGDMEATLGWAVEQGAHWVEPAPGAWKLAAQTLQASSRALAAAAVAHDAADAEAAALAISTSRFDADLAQSRADDLQGRIDFAVAALTGGPG